MNAHQRPKLEDYEGSLFIVLRTARYDDAKEEVEFGEIHLFVGSDYVIAVRHGEASELTAARKRLEDHEDLLGAGPGAVVWAIVDKVVDDYAPVVAGIDNDIEEVEDEIFGQRADSTQRIYFLKREVIEFHRAVSPLLGPLEGLQYGAQPGVSDELRRYFRDVHDHARRVDEQVTGQRELLTSHPGGQPGAARRATERCGAPDLRLGGDHHRADVPGLDLGHELRAHARARPDLGLSGRAGAHGGRRRSASTASSSGSTGSSPAR